MQVLKIIIAVLTIFLYVYVNPSMASVLILYAGKTPENLRFGQKWVKLEIIDLMVGAVHEGGSYSKVVNLTLPTPVHFRKLY